MAGRVGEEGVPVRPCEWGGEREGREERKTPDTGKEKRTVQGVELGPGRREEVWVLLVVAVDPEVGRVRVLVPEVHHVLLQVGFLRHHGEDQAPRGPIEDYGDRVDGVERVLEELARRHGDGHVHVKVHRELDQEEARKADLRFGEGGKERRREMWIDGLSFFSPFFSADDSRSRFPIENSPESSPSGGGPRGRCPGSA